MNRLTAIGLASLVAYGLLIATKYAGVVSAAPDDRAPPSDAKSAQVGDSSGVHALRPEPRQSTLASFPAPVPRAQQPSRLAGIALEFRKARDLKAFADELAAKAPNLRGDERYYLAKALEECLFATTVNEDLAAYSAKQKKQFLSGLTAGDPNNERRIAAYEASDSTQRCLGFQNAKLSQKDIDALYRAAAQQGDPRAQARIITAELSKSVGKPSADPAAPAGPVKFPQDEFSMLVGLLESRDPEAMMYVGQFLAQNAVSQNLRVGPNGEVPEPSAFLGAFTLVACDVGQDCTAAAMNRDLLQACAYGGYCNAQSFQDLYQDFIASPWAYTQAMRYRAMIHTAIDQQNWGLIGITPKLLQAQAK
ncbi:MAG TPA: hypothetical protein VFU92_03340 [Usitatibacter sp.]|nr:hypothetical protein [Usitatibacter sp.]